MPMMTAPARRLLRFVVVLSALCGCEGQGPPAAQDIRDDTVCSLDGMLLKDYPGPKAQIQYETGAPDFFCDTMEMFSIVLQPESTRRVRAVFTQDMAQADWQDPRDHWIDARAAYYVAGSRGQGSMGPTFASFARSADAENFAKTQGGRVLRFTDVTPEMADLRGGATRDEPM